MTKWCFRYLVLQRRKGQINPICLCRYILHRYTENSQARCSGMCKGIYVPDSPFEKGIGSETPQELTSLLDGHQPNSTPPPPPPIYNKIKRTDSQLNEWSTNLHCCKRNNQTHKAKETTEMWTRHVSFIIRLIWNRFTSKLTAI